MRFWVGPVQTHDGNVTLVRNDPRRVEAGGEAGIAVQRSGSTAVAVDVDDDVSGGAVGSPEPVVVVSGNRRRQAGPWTEEVEGGGFTVVAGDDRRIRASRRG